MITCACCKGKHSTNLVQMDLDIAAANQTALQDRAVHTERHDIWNVLFVSYMTMLLALLGTTVAVFCCIGPVTALVRQFTWQSLSRRSCYCCSTSQDEECLRSSAVLCEAQMESITDEQAALSEDHASDAKTVTAHVS